MTGMASSGRKSKKDKAAARSDTAKQTAAVKGGACVVHVMQMVVVCVKL